MIFKSKTTANTPLSKHYLEKQGMNLHLYLIHCARLNLIKKYLPKADMILDLGGVHSPLYQMGYPYPFKKMIIVDLPAEQSHEIYKDKSIVSDVEPEGGDVIVKFTNMIDLAEIGDASVDLVWSGQSIEHVSRKDGEKLCQNVFRVLKKGGSFCLDTPNRYLTEIHTKPVGGGFINPDHKFEYYTGDLRDLLKMCGFAIKRQLGLCHMPGSVTEFDYSEFIFNKMISRHLKQSYIQYYHCLK